MVTTISSRTQFSFERIEQDLRRQIAEGHLRPGQMLMGRRELARKHGVAVTTVQRAISELIADGTLRADNRRGTFVSNGSILEKRSAIEPEDDHGGQTSFDRVGSITSGRLLRNTIIFVSGSPRGVQSDHTVYGWADWTDQGAMDEIHQMHRHHLAFHPAMLHTNEWEELITQSPLGIVVIDINKEILPALPFVARARDRGIPVVVHGLEDNLDGVDRVASDHAQGAYEEVQWLHAQGRRRILMLDSGLHQRWLQERRRGYVRAVNELGIDLLPLVPDLSGEDLTPAAVETSIRTLAGYLYEHLHGKPAVDAILCLSDGGMSRVEAACRILGKNTDSDVLLAGYDNYWMEAKDEFPTRPAVTVDKYNHTLGAATVRLLFERLEGKLPNEPQLRLIKPGLVVPGAAQ